MLMMEIECECSTNIIDIDFADGSIVPDISISVSENIVEIETEIRSEIWMN